MFDFDQYPFELKENNVLEFKQDYTNRSINKYTQILCAFLNTNGGHIIFGINDSRMPVGLDMSDKQIDLALTSLDNILHNSKIMIVNIETKEKYKLNALTIQGRVEINKRGKKFIIVEAIPDPDYDRSKYRYIANGNAYYRLNASNYFDKRERIYTETELNYCIQKNDQLHMANLEIVKNEYDQLFIEYNEIKTELNNIKKFNFCSYIMSFFYNT